MTSLRVAAVGAGYFSLILYPGWKNIENVVCVALADRDLPKGHELAERSGYSLLR